MNTKTFYLSYIFLIIACVALNFVLRDVSLLSEEAGQWIFYGGIFFLFNFLALDIFLTALLRPTARTSSFLSVLILFGKLPILLIVTYWVSTKGRGAILSFIFGVLLFIPALIMSSAIRHVISRGYKD